MTTETKRKFKPFREIKSNGEVKLNLHRGQTQVEDSTARYVFMIESPQVGKTCYGPHWLEREIRLRGQGDYLGNTAEELAIHNMVFIGPCGSWPYFYPFVGHSYSCLVYGTVLCLPGTS